MQKNTQEFLESSATFERLVRSMKVGLYVKNDLNRLFERDTGRSNKDIIYVY